jgi:hypothetical protein
MQTEVGQERDHDAVVLWRRTQLVRSGFSLPLAAQVARDERYDLHALIEFVERGCPAELAVRILAPLDEEEAV